MLFPAASLSPSKKNISTTKNDKHFVRWRAAMCLSRTRKRCPCSGSRVCSKQPSETFRYPRNKERKKSLKTHFKFFSCFGHCQCFLSALFHPSHSKYHALPGSPPIRNMLHLGWSWAGRDAPFCNIYIYIILLLFVFFLLTMKNRFFVSCRRRCPKHPCKHC